MTASNSPDRSVFDDALASGGPAGDSGFDPNRPFMTRDGKKVKLTDTKRGNEYWPFGGFIKGDIHERYWRPDGLARRYGDNYESGADLINTPLTTVVPTPAGDVAKEKNTTIETPSYDLDTVSGAVAFDEQLREIANGIEVADAWQPIETAPKDGSVILLSNGRSVNIDRWVHWRLSQGGGWFNFQYSVPTHWRPLPAAPSPVPSDTKGYDGSKRPSGNNADEWLIYLKEWGATPMVAVQIAEAIDDAKRGASPASVDAFAVVTKELSSWSKRTSSNSYIRAECQGAKEALNNVLAALRANRE